MVDDMGVGEVSDVRVRAAEEGDLADFVELWYGVVKVDELLGYRGAERDKKTLIKEITRHIYKAWEDVSYLMLVAEEGEKIVGVLVGNLVNKGPMFCPSLVGMVELLCAREGEHQEYVNRELGRMFEALAVREGITRIEGVCCAGATNRRKELEKEGFRVESVRMVKDSVFEEKEE